MTTSLHDRNVSAERRAVGEQLRARLAPDLGCFLVASRGGPRHLTAWGVAGLLVVRCSCQPVRSYPGGVGCKHGAAVARRLRRAGLVYFDGLWRLTPKGTAGPTAEQLIARLLHDYDQIIPRRTR